MSECHDDPTSLTKPPLHVIQQSSYPRARQFSHTLKLKTTMLPENNHVYQMNAIDSQTSDSDKVPRTFLCKLPLFKGFQNGATSQSIDIVINLHKTEKKSLVLFSFFLWNLSPGRIDRDSSRKAFHARQCQVITFECSPNLSRHVKNSSIVFISTSILPQPQDYSSLTQWLDEPLKKWVALVLWVSFPPFHLIMSHESITKLLGIKPWWRLNHQCFQCTL